MTAHHVAIVFDPDFGDALRTLAQQMHVWVVDTPANKIIAREIWARHPAYSLEAGVTTFDRTGYSDAYGLLDSILGSVDDHHGVFDHDPTWGVLHIYGLPPDVRVRESLASYGATVTEVLADQFTASRQPPPAMIAPE